MLVRLRPTILFLMFVFSGFSGLLYQVVWTRLAFASFGVNTSVMSVVISVFMGGLALGTWASGRWVVNRYRTDRQPMILYYGLVEMCIAVSAITVPKVFGLGEEWLRSSDEITSIAYLTKSAMFIGFSVLPWCFLMGCTFPLMAAYLKERNVFGESGFSFLYLGNVVGATGGVLITALILIELWGFESSLRIGGGINILVGVIAILIGVFSHTRRDYGEKLSFSTSPRNSLPFSKRISLMILIGTGFISMAMEVVWIRAFTPILGTTIYAFASVLATYLAATFIGTFIYRISFKTKLRIGYDTLLVFIVAAASLPLVLPFVHNVSPPEWDPVRWVPLLSIVPFCVLLGFLTPRLIDEYSRGHPDSIGHAYASNIVGSLIGPIVAGYLLLPLLGAKWSLIMLALPLLGICLIVAKSSGFRWNQPILLILGVGTLMFSAKFGVTLEDAAYYQKWYKDVEVRRDYAATVISHRQPHDGPHDRFDSDRLLVNGVGMTGKTPNTKMMAHLPMYFHGEGVENTLIICLGMGTTLRSLVAWDVPVTVVELIPSVRDAFPYYFTDAKQVLSKPNVEVIIDDGRRYLHRTNQKFDVITIDPPPPAESAASSLLYSVEFYELSKTHLTDNGILQQWLPGSTKPVLEAVVGALVKVFPYVRIFRSVEGWGYHFLASKTPIPDRSLKNATVNLPRLVVKDLAEWVPAQDLPLLFSKMKEVSLEEVITGGQPSFWISDNWPINEYFFLRWGKEFIVRTLMD